MTGEGGGDPHRGPPEGHNDEDGEGDQPKHVRRGTGGGADPPPPATDRCRKGGLGGAPPASVEK